MEWSSVVHTTQHPFSGAFQQRAFSYLTRCKVALGLGVRRERIIPC